MSGASRSRVRALALAAALLAALPALAQGQDREPTDAPGQELPASDPAPAPKPFGPVDLLLGAGSENFSRAGSISGGNYAYGELALRFFGHFTAAARVSAELVPDPFAELLAVAGVELMSPTWGAEYYSVISVSWAVDLRESALLPGVVLVGLRLLDSGFVIPELSMSILPLTISWDLESGTVGFGYEFIKFRVVLD